MRRTTSIFVSALLLVVCATLTRAADGENPSTAKKDVTRAAVRLVLREGLFRGDSPDKGNRPNLVLFADSSNGRWGLAWGMALDFNQGIHTGIIREVAIEPGKASFRFDILFGKDIWTPGGRGVYDVEVTRDGNSVSGTYKADFRGHTYTGKVEGEILPPREILDKDHQPIEPGTHPQVLLQKHNLPTLRKRLQTPLGKAYLEQFANSGDIINLGILYQLTGDRKYAQKAEKIVSGYKKLNREGFGSGGFGHQMVAVALAYDLCYDAWSDNLRRRVRKKLEWFIPYYQKYLMTSHPNYHPCSNYYGPGRGAAGICALVLWGEKGPKPTPPKNPLAAQWNITPIKADAAGKGVPIVEYEPGQIPDKWITSGPLPLDGKQDILSGLGGYAKAQPQVGTTCKYITIDVENKLPKYAMMVFSKLDDKAAGDKGVDLGKVLDKPRPVRMVLYTVLKFDEEAVISLDAGENTRAWLGGQPMDEHFYRVTPGHYPLMVVHESKTGKGTVAPSLKTADADAFAARRDLYQRSMDRWEQDVALWEKYDGADPTFIRAVEISRYTILQHFLVGVGKGGFQAETGGYSNIASYFPMVFAELYRDMFGRNASPYDDITHLLPRRMMQHVFPEGGGSKAQKLNSGHQLDLTWLARGYPIVPDEYKPAVLWAWNHVAGVTGPETVGHIFGKGGHGLDRALAFVNYPLDAEPKHPSKVMPLHWEASTFGFYAFRNRWKNADDFVAQVFLKSHPIYGWNHSNAGAWRLWGLGHPWSVGPTSREGHRVQESVVLLPEDEINVGLGGQKEYLETRPDGTAVLVADMNDHYSAKPARKARKIFDANLLRRPDARVDSGITGKRAFAFDYSGLSGSPCLVVLVDDIKGGGKKEWLFQKSDGKLAVHKDGFTLDKGDANLKATFVAPAKVDVSVPDRSTEWQQHGTNTIKWNAVLATGGDTYFVVMTIQKGQAPAVSVDGKGPDATVTVGKRTIRWDGKKIILGEK
ncbi:MAG: hypothetical protein ACLFV7_09590 [Phycisphaerae bacterium]